MEETLPLPLPRHVRHQDGRLFPFDPDDIHRTLYRATELRGQPDTFLSRELADSILAFLPERVTDEVIAAAEIMDLATAVLRELGQPALATLFSEVWTPRANKPQPEEAVSSPFREQGIAGILEQKQPWAAALWHKAHCTAAQFSLDAGYARQILDAHHEGLLTLGQLGVPRELAAAVIRWPDMELLGKLERVRTYVGEEVVFDTLEQEWLWTQEPAEVRRAKLQELARACRWLGLRLSLHLNAFPHPDWAAPQAPPLFPSRTKHEAPSLQEIQVELLTFAEQFTPVVQVYWHVGEDGRQQELTREAKAPLQRFFHHSGFLTLQRETVRKGVRLHSGLDRRRTALLHSIDLHLDNLVRRYPPGMTLDTFCGKVLSLARLALSAAKARRDMIRRWQLPGWPAFLLDQAHVCLRLCGVERAVEALSEGDSILALHEALARRLPKVVARDATVLNLSVTLEPVQELQWHAMDFTAHLRQAAAAHALWGSGLACLFQMDTMTDDLFSLLTEMPDLEQVLLTRSASSWRDLRDKDSPCSPK